MHMVDIRLENVTLSAMVRAEQHRTNFLDDSRNVNLPCLLISRATAIHLVFDCLQLRRQQIEAYREL